MARGDVRSTGLALVNSRAILLLSDDHHVEGMRRTPPGAQRRRWTGPHHAFNCILLVGWPD